MISGQLKVDLTPLDGLRRSLVTKIMRKATTEAVRVVRTAIKSNAQAVRRYGFLAKSIGIKVKMYNGVAVGIVGPRTKYVKARGSFARGEHKGQPRVARPSKYLHLIERGTKRSKARPILGPALDATKSQWVEVLSHALERGIAAEL